MNLLAAVLIAADDTEFDPDTVTPGVEGFLITGLFGLAVILLGVSLVRRIRRNSYRHQVREQLAAELEDRGSSGAGSGDDGLDEGRSGDTDARS